MVATRKNCRRQFGGQPTQPKSLTEAKAGVPPTYTCPPGTGTPLTGIIGMCGKCDNGFILVGNVCVNTTPILPTLVKAVAATAACPPGSTLNGALCEYPPPPKAVRTMRKEADLHR